MKKFLAALAFLLSLSFITAEAQVIRYQASSFAIATVDRYGQYTWGNWNSSSVIVYIDYDLNYIFVASNKIQGYKIIKVYESFRDEKGGVTVKMDIYDQDQDYGKARLRFSSEGQVQLYIDWNDVAWCYSGLTKVG